MLNKALVFGGIALMAILVIENMVVPSQAFLFIDSGSSTWKLSLISSIIGAGIGYGIRGFSIKEEEDNSLNF